MTADSEQEFAATASLTPRSGTPDGDGQAAQTKQIEGQGEAEKVDAAEKTDEPLEPEKVHDYYDDPKADIALLAKDGTVFRVHGHMVKKKR